MSIGFLHGVNYPWSTDGSTIYYGLDFGANVWGSHLGVSTRRGDIQRDFATMAGLGFTVARWFLFGDGRAGIVYGDDGLPAGTDPHFFVDLDAALEIARDVEMRIDFVLLDHRWMFTGIHETIADPASGELLDARLPDGRAAILLSDDGRDALFETVIAPLVHRYGPAGARADLAGQIAAFELMNEPDFVIDEWERDLSPQVHRPLPFEVIAELVSRLSDVVHRHSLGFTTLGGARAHNLWAWDDDALGLDVLQLHWYPDAQTEDVSGLIRTASDLGVRRRVILGEFPGELSDDYLEYALSSGYAGAWPWSFSGTDKYGTLPVEPLRRFAERYPGLVNARAREEGSA